MHLWLQLTGRHPRIQKWAKITCWSTRAGGCVEALCIFLQSLSLSPLPICSFGREGLEWGREWGCFSNENCEGLRGRESNLPGEAAALTVPFHAWSFHFCLFLDSFLSIGLLNVGDTQGSVFSTSLYILYSPHDWPIYKHGFSYPWSLLTFVFPALMSLLNFGPFYPFYLQWDVPNHIHHLLLKP